MSKLLEEIRAAINRSNAEQGSDTPDFILAKYLLGCLAEFDKAIKARQKWYGGAPTVEPATSPPPMTDHPSKEIIIASYREDMEWVWDIPRDWRITIYNTGQKVYPFEVIPLPNVGREASQWLHHLVQRYDSIAEFSLFVQADKAHLPEEIDRILEAKELPSHQFCYLGSSPERFPLPARPLPATLKLLLAGWQDASLIPSPCPFQIGAQFYVRREMVHRRPKDHYGRILEAIHQNITHPHSAAHLLEGSWSYIFQP